MRRILVAAAAAAALLSAPPAFAAAKPKPKPVSHDQLPLHVGSSGPRVVLLQELLAGHSGNVFHQVKPLYKEKPNGYFGAGTGAAVFAWKYRIGIEAKYNPKSKPIAGADFFNLLTGKTKRTLLEVALAQQRLQAVEAGMTPLAFAIKKVEVGQLGADENLGANCGSRIDAYFKYFGIGCGLPWCEIFQQWAFAEAGYKPPFADRSFLVTYTAAWARQHGYLNAKAKAGDLVAFLDDGGHIGYVIRVFASGYETIEGNSDDRVQEVVHPWNSRLRVFIALPRVAF